MSTKKLSRTIIEGGRRNGYKHERKQSLRSARRISKEVVKYSKKHSDDFCEVNYPKRKHSSYYDVEKFYDKTHPTERWMESRVGKSWNKTYSMLREKFDIRTTPGRHVLLDHMLRSVWTSQDRSTLLAQSYEYYVDGQGILRKNANRRNRYNNGEWNKIHVERNELGDWLQGRLIDKIGEVLYWFEPTNKVPNPLYFRSDYYGLEFYYDRQFDQYNRPYGKTFYTPYRQGTRLAGADVEYFSKLYEENKDWLLRQSPLIKKYSPIWMPLRKVSEY